MSTDREQSEGDRQEAREIRNLLVARSQRHEEEEHGGEPCLGDRVGLIAFLAHALGLQPIHMDLVAGELAEYQAQHDALHHHENGREH